jgi:hypothetical protein
MLLQRSVTSRAPSTSVGQRSPVAGRPFPTGMVVTVIAMLVAGLALQLVVYGSGGHSSLSDLPRVFLHRGIGPGAFPYVDRVIEYPVGAGMFLYLASLMSPTPLGVLVVTALTSTVLCVAITVVLERRVGRRAWRWALALPILLYAFQNWDMFAIAALVTGLLAFERGHDRFAGAALGVGAAIKLFPAVVVLPLAAVRLACGDRRGALRLTASSAATFAVLNLPFVILNRSGWWWPFTFQGNRHATWGSVWFYIFRIVGAPVHGANGASFANAVSFVALAVALSWLVLVTIRRRLTPFPAAAAAVALFLLCNKVYSPTYDVWLVVFFVLVPLRSRLWVMFCAVDMGVFVVVYGYFNGLGSRSVVELLLPMLVLVRTVVLLAIIRDSTNRRAPTNVDHDQAGPRVGRVRRARHDRSEEMMCKPSRYIRPQCAPD